jgi:hypothetical protein
MLRRNVIIAGILLACGSMAVKASAQPGGGGGFFGRGGSGGTAAMLLAIPEVQAELKLSEDQKTKLDTISQDVREKARASFGQINFQELQNLTDEERQKKFDEMRKKADDVTKGVDDKVSGILDVKQKDRLKQLQLQREGAMALIRPEVIKKLELTEEQQAKIKKVQEDGRPTGLNRLFDPNQTDEERTAARKKLQDQMEKVQKDCLAVLTDDQMLDWTNMCGKTFKFPEMQMRRRGNQGPPPGP